MQRIEQSKNVCELISSILSHFIFQLIHKSVLTIAFNPHTCIIASTLSMIDHLESAVQCKNKTEICDVEWAICQLCVWLPRPPQVNSLPRGSTWYLADFIHLGVCVVAECVCSVCALKGAFFLMSSSQQWLPAFRACVLFNRPVGHRAPVFPSSVCSCTGTPSVWPLCSVWLAHLFQVHSG